VIAITVHSPFLNKLFTTPVFRWPNRTWLAVAGVSLLLISPLWYPTPDSVCYLSIGRSLACDAEAHNLGSPHPMYSVGYPVLMAPILRLHVANPFLLLSILRALFAGAFLFGIRKWANGLLDVPADLIANLTLVNVVVLALFRRDLSEVAFMPLLFALANSFRVIRDQLPNVGRRPLLFAGLLLLLVVTVRPTGFLFVAGLALSLLIAVRRRAAGPGKAIAILSIIVTPAVLALGALLLYEQMTASRSGQISNFDMLLNHRLVEAKQSLPQRLLEGLRVRISEVGRLTVPGMFGAFVSHGNWRDWNLLVYVPVFGLICRGWWKWLHERADVLAFSLPLYFALHVYWPWDQAGRYFAPLLPALFVCLWHGLDFLGNRRLRLFQILLLLHLTVSLGFWGVRELPRGLENRRDLPSLGNLAALIREDAHPVAASTTAPDAGLILAWLLDRPVGQVRSGEPMPELVYWLILLESEASPPEFEMFSGQGRFRLYRRCSPSVPGPGWPDEKLRHGNFIMAPVEPPLGYRRTSRRRRNR